MRISRSVIAIVLRIIILTPVTALGMSACGSGQPMDPDPARSMVRNAWQANQHIVWEIEWPAVPIGGPLTVETWRADERYRYEILEAAAPALIGQTLVFNGQTAWQFNRFGPDPPRVFASPALSPVSDAFAIIDAFVTTQPLTANQAEGRLSHGPARMILLTFENNESLTFWIDRATGLPGRIIFWRRGDEATLQARSLERLPNPPAGLFEVDR
jgi:hypothetical protein